MNTFNKSFNACIVLLLSTCVAMNSFAATGRLQPLGRRVASQFGRVTSQAEIAAAERNMAQRLAADEAATERIRSGLRADFPQQSGPFKADALAQEGRLQQMRFNTLQRRRALDEMAKANPTLTSRIQAARNQGQAFWGNIKNKLGDAYQVGEATAQRGQAVVKTLKAQAAEAQTLGEQRLSKAIKSSQETLEYVLNNPATGPARQMAAIEEEAHFANKVRDLMRLKETNPEAYESTLARMEVELQNKIVQNPNPGQFAGEFARPQEQVAGQPWSLSGMWSWARGVPGQARQAVQTTRQTADYLGRNPMTKEAYERQLAKQAEEQATQTGTMRSRAEQGLPELYEQSPRAYHRASEQIRGKQYWENVLNQPSQALD